MSSEIFFDLVVPRHWLANLCHRILIPIVLSTVPLHLPVRPSESARVASRQLKLGVLTNVWDRSRRQILVEIEEVFF
jgi:hypothetical protein